MTGSIVIYSTAYENIEITTRSHPDAFPSALQQKRSTQTKTHNADEIRLRVSEEISGDSTWPNASFFILGDRVVSGLWSS